MMSFSGRTNRKFQYTKEGRESSSGERGENSYVSLAQGSKWKFLKGISSCISRCWEQGSMTVEAAVVLPIFIFFFLNISSVMEMLCLHGRLATALWETGNRLAVYGYACEQLEEGELGNLLGEGTLAGELVGLALTNLYVRSEVITYVGEDFLDSSPLTYGRDGLNFLESSLPDEEDCIDLKVTYQVSSWFPIPGFSSFRMSNRYYARAWTGYELSVEEGEEAYVYITEHGQVYHESAECSYLHVNIRQTDLDRVEDLHNEYGQAYTECWRCREAAGGTRVFITTNGIRYHYQTQCPGLQRSVRRINRLAAAGYRPCSRCAGG